MSYSTFEYSNISVDAERIDAASTIKVSFDVTNTGRVAGKEIAQLYSRVHAPRLIRPLRELKGFAKVNLDPGETKRVDIVIEARDLRYYDPDHGQWLLDAGKLSIEIGASSRDIRLEKTLDVDAAARPSTILNVESQPFMVLEQEFARKRFGAFLKDQLNIDDEKAEKMMEYCAGSFLGIYNTVAWVAGDKISKVDMAEFLDGLNKEMGVTISKAA